MHILDRNAQLGNTNGSMLFACDSPDPFELIAPVETRIIICRNIFSLLNDLIVMITDDRFRVRCTLRHNQLVIYWLLDVVVIIVAQVIHADTSAMRLRSLASHNIILRLCALLLKRPIIVYLLLLMLQFVLGLKCDVYWVHHLSFLDA